MKDIISKKVRKMDVSGVRRMFEMASKIKNPISLTLGLPDFDVPEKVKNEAIKAIEQGKNRYSSTTGISDLKKRIKKKLKEKNKIDVELDELIVTSAGSGGLSIILTTIVEKGDEIIIFDPYFVAYKQLILQNQGKPICVKTKEDFSIDFKKLNKSISKKTKAIIINSPNNPAGKIYDKKDLKELAKIAGKHDLLVISDEVYEDFAYDKKCSSIGSFYKDTITINSFAKSHAMTGWRVGYCCGPKEIIQQAIKVQQFNFVCAPTPFQYSAIKALDTEMKEKIKEYKEKRKLIYEGLKKNYNIKKPEGAFYCFVEYPYDSEKFIKNCIDNSLLVVPGDIFSEENTHFRISFANKNSELKKAIKILNKISKP